MPHAPAEVTQKSAKLLWVSKQGRPWGRRGASFCIEAGIRWRVGARDGKRLFAVGKSPAQAVRNDELVNRR